MDQARGKSGALLGTLVAGALVSASVGSAPVANATCASFFSIGNSASCKSNLTSIAIAIGPNATADAFGFFGTAISLGKDSQARTGVRDSAVVSMFNAAIAVSLGGIERNEATAASYLSLAVTAGKGSAANAGGNKGDFANAAVNLFGNFTTTNLTLANGTGAVAVNLFGKSKGDEPGSNDVAANGILTSATNLAGASKVYTGSSASPNRGILTLAFNAFGDGNVVYAGDPGPLSVAGAIGQNGVTVEQRTPGFNIYTRFSPGAASAGRKTTAPTAATPTPAATLGSTADPVAPAVNSISPAASTSLHAGAKAKVPSRPASSSSRNARRAR